MRKAPDSRPAQYVENFVIRLQQIDDALAPTFKANRALAERKRLEMLRDAFEVFRPMLKFNGDGEWELAFPNGEKSVQCAKLAGVYQTRKIFGR